MTGNNGPNDKLSLARDSASRLIAVPGIAAVALGGSAARGMAHPDSDLDIGIYYDPERVPDLEALQALAMVLDDRHPHRPLTDFGGWGPWINGGGWLTIAGHRVDWLYRDLARVEAVVEECRVGCSTLSHQPGHPHGFHSHIYLGEVAYALPLADPNGCLARLKALAVPYPPALRRSLTRDFLWQAGFALEIAAKPAARGDVAYVAGCLFQCVADLVQVLYALNGRYFVNEKGSVAEAADFALLPDGWHETVESVLACPGASPEALSASLGRLTKLHAATVALAERILRDHAQPTEPGAQRAGQAHRW